MQAPVEERTDNVDGTNTRGLIASVVSDAQRLVGLEVALAKQEIKELATRNAIAVAILVFGGLLVALGILVALPVLIVALMGWEAAAIWLAAYMVVGIVLVLIGKSRLAMRLPTRTLGSLKENKEWALRRVRSNGR